MIHIGSGQNVFNIAYYGLLNPVIMISYLFPFIRMLDYIIISNIILYVLSNLLFYKFIKDKFDNPLFLTFIFMLAGPLLFQLHRHFMFVNYMPFLILSLINIDGKKYSRLIIDILLIIMTSFYYSIPSILVILIYFIYVNFNEFSIKILGPIRVKDKCINGIFCGNTDSINFILTYKNTKYFFTGDYVQSDKILSNYNRSELSNVDFIKQPHHGLHDYISQDLISIMRPKIIFVPNGREHMSSTMRSWYSSVGAKIYNTYSEENLVAVSDGNNIKVYTNASATSFRR